MYRLSFSQVLRYEKQWQNLFQNKENIFVKFFNGYKNIRKNY